jgi:hypothetical protein
MTIMHVRVTYALLSFLFFGAMFPHFMNFFACLIHVFKAAVLNQRKPNLVEVFCTWKGFSSDDRMVDLND